MFSKLCSPNHVMGSGRCTHSESALLLVVSFSGDGGVRPGVPSPGSQTGGSAQDQR